MIAVLLRDATALRERAVEALERQGPSLSPTQHLWLQRVGAHLRSAKRLLELINEARGPS